MPRFGKEPSQSLNRPSKEKQIEVYKAAIKKLGVSDAFSADLIWELIYSKKAEGGFEPSFQKATHLVTSVGDLLRTQDLSLNFIFEDLGDDYHYEFLYDKLPYVLIFMFQVELEAYNRISAINEKTYSHHMITMMGTYEALFLDGRSQTMTRLLKRSMKELLKCIHCEAPLRITKKTAPGLYINERIPCEKCGLQAEVPLYWLFATAGLVITRDDDPEPSDPDPSPE